MRLRTSRVVASWVGMWMSIPAKGGVPCCAPSSRLRGAARSRQRAGTPDRGGLMRGGRTRGSRHVALRALLSVGILAVLATIVAGTALAADPVPTSIAVTADPPYSYPGDTV